MRRIWELPHPVEKAFQRAKDKISIPLISGENGPEGWKTTGILSAILRLFKRR